MLYHRIGRGHDNVAFLYPANAVTLGVDTWRGSALELPFLAKFRFLDERSGWRPFASVGPTVRRTSITTSTTRSVMSGSPLNTGAAPVLTTGNKQWNVDPSAGLGVDILKARFHIEPDFLVRFRL